MLTSCLEKRIELSKLLLKTDPTNTFFRNLLSNGYTNSAKAARDGLVPLTENQIGNYFYCALLLADLRLSDNITEAFGLGKKGQEWDKEYESWDKWTETYQELRDSLLAVPGDNSASR